MGGFVLEHDRPDGRVKRQRVHPEKLIQMFQDESSALSVSSEEASTMFRPSKLPWPALTDQDIDARSKADWIVKTIAIAQILWFVANTIGRAIQHLAVTTLELFTLGILVCAIFIYIACWEKPFDVQVPVVLRSKEVVPVEDCVNEVELFDDDKAMNNILVWCIGVAICLMFGAIHVVAWNFHFPSYAEKILWRISSTGCAALPTLLLIWNRLDYFGGLVHEVATMTIICSYALFRAYMFVEMFVSLRSVPASVYQTPQWSQYFPAIG
jgi:hypothetical protein